MIIWHLFVMAFIVAVMIKASEIYEGLRDDVDDYKEQIRLLEEENKRLKIRLRTCTHR